MRTAVWVVLSALAVSGEQLPYRTFSTADGLVRNTITRIRRDPNGCLWICTVEGLSLFDGTRFTNYTVADGLPDPRVNDLAPAGDGSYWLATGGGLFRFRPRRALTASQSQKPTFEPVGSAGESHPPGIGVLLLDRSGVLWAGGRSGLYRVPPNSKSLQRVPLEPAEGFVLALHEDPARRLWVGTTDGLYRVSEGSLAAVRVYPAASVRAIHTDRRGRFWIGHEEGLTRLDAGIDRPEALERLGRKAAPLLSRVFAIAESPGDELWIATFGLVRFRPDSPDPNDRIRGFDLPPEWVQYTYSIETGPGGSVWAGIGRMGLLALSSRGFSVYTEADGLPSTKVSGMIANRPKPLVVTIDSVYSWNEFNGSRFFQILPQVPKSILSMGWGHGSIVLQGADGSWWVATQNGLLHYPAVDNPRKLSGLLVQQRFTERDGLPSGVILQLMEDSRGDLWVGALNGVARRDRTTGRWYAQFTQDLAGESRPVETIVEDHAGAVWLGLADLGLARFRQGRFERITGGLPKGINSLFVDSRGRLWIAASRGGLGRIDHPEHPVPEVRLYGASDGMSSADLFSVGEDLFGHVYVAGGNGVDRLNPETGEIRHFAADDGIRGEPEHVYRDRSGAMWFTSIYGISRYEPQPDEPVALPPPLIRSIHVSAERRMVSDLGERAISEFTLKPGETGLDIEVGAVRFGSGEKLRYQHRLDTAGAGWSAPFAGPVVSMAGLSPGKYRLLVRAIDAGGATSRHFATVEFRAVPYVWQRLWFRVVMFAALLAGAAVVHRARVRRLLHLERIRSRIAADLHDDIGASLSQVAILSEVARRRAHDAATVERHTEKIAVICRDLIDSTSDIVWAVSPRHDSVTDLAQRMREFAGEILTAKDIPFRFDITPSDGHVRLDADIRRQIYLVFKEAIHNVARHSGATEVQIQLHTDGNSICLTVEDNGRGLDGAAGARNGHGLANMRTRAQSLRGTFTSETRESGGARLQARLPLS